jgi:hypothetical protein
VAPLDHTTVLLYNKYVAQQNCCIFDRYEEGTVLKNVTGQVVQGDDFFDRDSEISRYWNGLETDNLLLLAPRRVGKSSVLRRMKANAATKGFFSIYIDVSDCNDELRFVQRLYSAILEHHGSADRLWNALSESWLGKTISRVKKAGAAGFSIEFESDESSWARMGEELAEALSELDGRTLIQVDEIPVFVLKLLNREDESNQGRVREFLYWLRRLRQHYPQVRWMMAGSIGLDTVTSRLNIADSINDLRIETLGAFNEDTSNEFLHSLAIAYGVTLDKPARDHIFARVGWLVPYYLQLIFAKIRDVKNPSVADVDEAVNILLGPQHKSVFDYWRQRLRDELGRPDSDHAALLLHSACRTPEGAPLSILKLALGSVLPQAEKRDDGIRYLLDVLENDGYLVAADKHWKFRSPLLREYWLRRVAPAESEDE